MPLDTIWLRGVGQVIGTTGLSESVAVGPGSNLLGPPEQCNFGGHCAYLLSIRHWEARISFKVQNKNLVLYFPFGAAMEPTSGVAT